MARGEVLLLRSTHPHIEDAVGRHVRLEHTFLELAVSFSHNYMCGVMYSLLYTCLFVSLLQQ